MTNVTASRPVPIYKRSESRESDPAQPIDAAHFVPQMRFPDRLEPNRRTLPGDSSRPPKMPQKGGIVPAFTPPPLPSDDKRWKIVNGTMRKNGFARHALIETLHTVQSSFGYLDDEAIKFVAQSLRVPLSQAYGVVTFYHYFSLKPPGKHTVTVCAGTACYIKGADKLIAAAEKKLGIAQGQTTKDGNISLMVRALRGRLQPRSRGAVRRRSERRDERRTDARATGKVDRRMTIEELEQIAKSVHQENEKYDYEVNVCMDLACASQGADKLRDALVKAAEASGKKVLIRKTGCMGPCSSGPLVRVDPEETLYAKVKDANAEAIVNSLGDKPVPELQCDLNEHFDKQVRVVLENAGHIDPEKIDDYISRDGYKALMTALLEMTPNGVVHRITESGLRGRGGGGYPTGLKWSTVAKAGGDVKYVVCNGDEGDPGAFMDRSVMEGDPHRVIEGMAIAAYAVGASKGFIYVRAEYPVAVSPADHRHSRSAAARAAGQRHRRHHLQLRHRDPPGRRRVCLRRGDGADRLHRRPARHAQAAAALSGGQRALGQAHADQQRGDLRQHRAHRAQRRQVVLQHGLGAQQGHQGLRAHRQNHQHRPD